MKMKKLERKSIVYSNLFIYLFIYIYHEKKKKKKNKG
jgi:hypothetical protein